MKFKTDGFKPEELRSLYEAILFPRVIEEKMLVLLRQGKISKWFSGIGQEAIAVGVAKALKSKDYILPLHRNLGVFTGREIPFATLFAQWQGKKDGFTKGRDRSFHFGTNDYRIIGMISHLGAMLPVADGISLASNLDGDDIISCVFSGDGGASEGDFHEAINVAAVWDLPVIFLIENNGYGLSTPSKDQFRFKQFTDKAIGYGIEGIQVDGNNILEVYTAVKKIAEKMRVDRKPVMLECMTFRMRGHEEASGTKYVPKELFAQWEKKDPVMNYENFLKKEGILTEEIIADLKKKYKKEIEQGLEIAFAMGEPEPNEAEEIADVFQPHVGVSFEPTSLGKREIRVVDAVCEGLKQAMEKDPKLIIMGQDVAEYGGVFKVTDGFVEKFGKERVRNTPLCESAIIGAGLGLSIRGRSSVIEMQFADFVSCGFNQIVNNLAKTHYRWNQNASVVVRMPTGAGSAAGPFHSQSNEAWFAKVPGLKIVYPSTPADAKGLLTASIEDPNPVIFFEHKALYRSISGPVPEHYYTLPIGKAAIAGEGTDLSIITYGWGVHQALRLRAELEEEASIEVIDLRTLIPWDEETVLASVKKTGKVLVVHEDTLTMGIGAEISACISEKAFTYLDAPVMRLGSLDTPVPFHKSLEDQFLPWNRMQEKIEELIAY